MTNRILDNSVTSCYICDPQSATRELCAFCDSVLHQLPTAEPKQRATLATEVLMTCEKGKANRLLEAAGVLDTGLVEEHVARIKGAAHRFWNGADKWIVANQLRNQGFTDDEISIGRELYWAERTKETAHHAVYGQPEYGTLPEGFWTRR
jgi:hypothetical protein